MRRVLQQIAHVVNAHARSVIRQLRQGLHTDASQAQRHTQQLPQAAVLICMQDGQQRGYYIFL